jgi:hypothetical protein
MINCIKRSFYEGYMKIKRLLIFGAALILIIATMLLAVSCDDTKQYNIEFSVDGEIYYVLTVIEGSAIELPEAPEKEGYVVEWDVTVDVATGNVTVNAVYTEIPQTDDGYIWLVVCFVGALTAVVALNELKRKKNVR